MVAERIIRNSETAPPETTRDGCKVLGFANISATEAVIWQNSPPEADGPKEPGFEELLNTLKAARLARQILASRKNSPSWAQVSREDKELVEKTLSESQEIRGSIKLPDKSPKLRIKPAIEIIQRGKEAHRILSQRLREHANSVLQDEYGDKASVLSQVVESSIRQVIANTKHGEESEIQEAVRQQIGIIGGQQISDIQRENLGEEMQKHETLVWHLINKFSGALAHSGISQNDAFQKGRQGVIEALSKYDPDKGPLANYLYPIVRGRLLDLIRREQPTTRYDQNKTRKINDFEAQFEAINGRSPTVEETANGTGLDKDEVQSVKGLPIVVNIGDLSAAVLEKIVYETHGSLADDDPLGSPETYLLQTEESKEWEMESARLKAAIELLSERNTAIIKMYFFEGMPLWEIGKKLGISESRASQLNRKALARIKKLLTEPVKLKDFLRQIGISQTVYANNKLGEGLQYQRAGRSGAQLGPIEQLTIKQRVEEHRRKVLEDRELRKQTTSARNERRKEQKARQRLRRRISGDGRISRRRKEYKPIRPEDLEILLEWHNPELEDREIRVLRLRAGLEDGKHWTHQEVAKDLGLKTGSGALIIEKKALAKLHQLEPSVFR